MRVNIYVCRMMCLGSNIKPRQYMFGHHFGARARCAVHALRFFIVLFCVVSVCVRRRLIFISTTTTAAPECVLFIQGAVKARQPHQKPLWMSEWKRDVTKQEKELNKTRCSVAARVICYTYLHEEGKATRASRFKHVLYFVNYAYTNFVNYAYTNYVFLIPGRIQTSWNLSASQPGHLSCQC